MQSSPVRNILLFILAIPGIVMSAYTPLAAAQLVAPIASSSQTICYNTVPDTISATEATGCSGSYTYQWQDSIDGGAWANIVGATALIYTPGVLTEDTYYRIIATDNGSPSCGTVASNVILITVVNFDPGGIYPTPQAYCEGGDPTQFTSTSASGDGTFTYQWQSSPDNITFSAIIGATSELYDPPALFDDIWYRRVAISTLNPACTNTSTTIEIRINNVNPGSISSPKLNYCNGDDPLPFSSVNATGDGPIITYQWEINPDGSTWINITVNGTNATYNPPPPITANTWYRRKATSLIYNISCYKYSNTIILSVYPVPTFTVNSPVELCEDNPYTIQATPVNTTGTPTYTIHYVSGTYPVGLEPANSTNTSGTFIFNPLPAPNEPVVGLQTFSVTITNGDAGQCTASQNVIVKLFEVPNMVVQTYCSSGNDGKIVIQATLNNANFTGQDVGFIEYTFDGDTTWTTNNEQTGLQPGSYTVGVRNSAHPGCSAFITLILEEKTTQVTDYSICQYATVPAGQGLQAYALCFTYTYGQTNYSQVANQYPYYRSTLADSYSAGTTPEYYYTLTFQAPDTQNYQFFISPSDQPAYMTFYHYPFDPLQPGNNFMHMYANTLQGNISIPLIAGQIYTMVVSTPNTNQIIKIQLSKVGNSQFNLATPGQVYWYQDETSPVVIYTGSPFNPVGRPELPNTNIPGTYTYYAGCGNNNCREPANFIVIPIPIVVAVNDTICSGQTANIQLSSHDNLNNVIDPLTVTYTWYAIPNNDVNGEEGCTQASKCTGSLINLPLTITTQVVCATVTFMVQASVSGCTGNEYPVNVLIIKNNSITINPPLPPQVVNLSCVSDTTPAPSLTATHACFGTIYPQYSETSNSGSGCNGDPLIITRTWIFIDKCGTASAIQTITIVDNIAPTFIAPNDTILNVDEFCSADTSVVNTGSPTNISDNCSTGLQATHTNTIISGCQGSSVITRHWHLVDDCGNAAPDQVQTITVRDTIPPTFTRPPNITIYADSNCNYNASLAVTGDVTNVHDNCSTGIQATYVDQVANGSCPGKKIITRTWSLVDNCGNAAPNQVQKITVLDLIPPAFTSLPAPIRYFCVIDIITASFYPDTMDITPVRPDYYILSDADKSSLNLDPATFWDNCTPAANLILHWRIDFAGGIPAPITGTGQISAHSGVILFPGDPYVEVTHTISYWLEDGCQNLAEAVVLIIIKHRPHVIKIY